MALNVVIGWAWKKKLVSRLPRLFGYSAAVNAIAREKHNIAKISNHYHSSGHSGGFRRLEMRSSCLMGQL